MSNHTELLEKVKSFQDLAIDYATGKHVDNAKYEKLRQELLAEPLLKNKWPEFIRTYRNLGQFWSFIQPKFKSYRERRQYLWEQFSPVLEVLETPGSPADKPVSEILARFDVEHVHTVWTRATERRTEDPAGAITSARTLLETVCKHILDESGATYEDNADLPKLYRLTADVLKLGPTQQSEDIFKRIFGGCQTVVEGLGALRNKLSDAHGKGKVPANPEPRHAELAVNLAGAMATFLVETWEARQPGEPAKRIL